MAVFPAYTIVGQWLPTTVSSTSHAPAHPLFSIHALSYPSPPPDSMLFSLPRGRGLTFFGFVFLIMCTFQGSLGSFLVQRIIMNCLECFILHSITYRTLLNLLSKCRKCNFRGTKIQNFHGHASIMLQSHPSLPSHKSSKNIIIFTQSQSFYTPLAVKGLLNLQYPH